MADSALDVSAQDFLADLIRRAGDLGLTMVPVSAKVWAALNVLVKRQINIAVLLALALCCEGCVSLRPGPSFPATPADPGYAGLSLPDGDALFLTELIGLIGETLGGVFQGK